MRIATWALVSLAVVLGMTRPSRSDITNTLPLNLGDPSFVTWVLAWESHAFTSHPQIWFDGNIFYPHGSAIGYSEIMLPLVPVYALVAAASGPLTAHNLTLILLLLMSVMSTHALARRLGISALPSFAAGVAFTFTSYTFIHLGHLQLLTFGFFSLGYLSLSRMFERRRAREGVIAGLATFAVVTSCLYYGAIWSLCIAIFLCLRVMVAWRRGEWRSLVRPLVAFAVTTAALVGPVVILYSRFQRSTGFTRTTPDESGLNLGDLLAPAPRSYLYRSAADAMSSRSGAYEHAFFPGLLVLAVGGLGVGVLCRAVARRRSISHREPWDARQLDWMGIALCGVVAFIVSLGPTVLGVPAPFRVVADLVPGFSSVRVPARLAVPALLLLALCAARGIEELGRWLGRVNLTGAIAVVAIAVELAAPFPRADARASAAERDLHNAVAALPDGPVVELPVALASDGARGVYLEAPRMLHSIGDWRQRFNGTSGGGPPTYQVEASVIATFPSPESLGLIRELGLRFVVVHLDSQDGYPGYSVDVVRGMEGAPGVRVAVTTPSAVVFEISPPGS